MYHPPATGIMPAVTNAREPIVYTTADDAVRHVIAERMAATNTRKVIGDERYFWPMNGQIHIYMSGLPEDCGDIAVTVHEQLEAAVEDGYRVFPVKSVEVDRESGRILVIGDEARVTEMRPMPTAS